MTDNTRGGSVSPYYFLMVSLYYPAVLGVLFVRALDELAAPTLSSSSALTVAAYVGILVAFSVDLLYSVASKAQYSMRYFIADLAVLMLLFLAYTDLISGLAQGRGVTRFFVCYTLIHGIFLYWDWSFVPKTERRPLVVAYDVFGLLVSLAGTLTVARSAGAAVIALWMCAAAYLVVGKLSIFKLVR